MCGIAPILSRAVGLWLGPYPVYSACCAILLPSYVQRLLCGIAPIPFTAPAVWSSDLS